MRTFTITFRDSEGAFVDGYTIRAAAERGAIATAARYPTVTARNAGVVIAKREVAAH